MYNLCDGEQLYLKFQIKLLCCWSFYYIFGTWYRPCTLESGQGVPEIATLFLQWDECVHILLTAKGSWSLNLSWLLRHDQREWWRFQATLLTHLLFLHMTLRFRCVASASSFCSWGTSSPRSLWSARRSGAAARKQRNSEKHVSTHKWKLII